jgi:O-antigen/teichoic acid export membrane protein
MFKQFLSFSIGPFAGALISVFSVPIITRLISPGDYGLLNFFMSIFSFLYLFISFPDYGYAKEYHQFKELRKENYLLWNTALISLIVGLLISTILILFSGKISVILFKNESFNSLLYLLVIMIISATFDRFSQLSIRMQGKGLSYSLVNVVNKLLILIFTVFMVLLYPDLRTASVFAFGIAQIITSITSFTLSRTSWGIKNVKINYKLQWELFKFSLPNLPTYLIMWGLGSLAIVFLKSYSSLYQIGIYSGAQRIANILAIVQTAVMSFWMPLAYKWEHEKVDTKEFTKVNELVLALMAGLFLLVISFKEIVILFLGREYQNAIYIIPFTLFFPIMFTLSEIIGVGFALKGKVYFNLVTSAIAILSFVIAGFYLIPKFGGIGAAVSTAISYTSLFWSKTLISIKVWYRFKLSKYVYNTILLIIVSIINTFIQSNLINIINILSLIIYVYANLNSLKYIVKVMKNQLLVK